MSIIDADKFLTYLIFSKHIDGLTCGEVKEAVEMCKVDVFDKIKSYIDHIRNTGMGKKKSLEYIEKFIDGLKKESEVSDADSRCSDMRKGG